MQKVVGALQKQTENRGGENKKQNPQHSMKVSYFFPPKNVTSWEIDGETVETVSDFIFWSSKITAYGDCSHEIKRRLLLGRKIITNLDNIFKSRDYFTNKGPSSQGYGFSSGHVWVRVGL